MDLSALFPAFFQALEPGMLGMVLLGTILGIVVGSLPGLTSTMGVALLVPFTFSMSPAMGLALLGAIYASSSYAGSISAILLRKLCKIRNFSQSPFGGFIFEESDGNFPSGRN